MLIFYDPNLPAAEKHDNDFELAASAVRADLPNFCGLNPDDVYAPGVPRGQITFVGFEAATQYAPPGIPHRGVLLMLLPGEEPPATFEEAAAMVGDVATVDVLLTLKGTSGARRSATTVVNRINDAAGYSHPWLHLTQPDI